MLKYIFYLSLISLLCTLSYQYGKSQAKIQIIEKEVKVIQYETKEICKIMAKPNLDDDNILRLLNQGKL